jgi:hypothetical protein
MFHFSDVNSEKPFLMSDVTFEFEFSIKGKKAKKQLA